MTTAENFNCVQESLNTTILTQQVAQQEQLKYNTEKYISSNPQLSIINSSNNSIFEEKVIEENCTETYYGASDKGKASCKNLTKSVQTMQLREESDLTLPQQKESQYSNSNTANRNNITNSNKTIENVTNNNNNTNNSFYNNNNKKGDKTNKTKVLATNIATKKSYKLHKKNKIKDVTETTNATAEAAKAETDVTELALSSTKATTATITNNDPSTDNGKTKTETETGKSCAVSLENETEDASANSDTTTDKAAVNPKSQKSYESLINYSESQWSPLNPNGKKIYDIMQLKQLREAKASRLQPEVNYTSILSSVDVGRNKSIIHLNLSLNEEVKLKEADNAWRPRTLVKSADTSIEPGQEAQHEKEELIRRVRGILNKLTPEKFEPLVKEIINLKLDTMDKIETVMMLVVEKAIDEPNFSESYAILCYRLTNKIRAYEKQKEIGTSTNANVASFHNSLVCKMEQEFTQNVTNSSAKEEKLRAIREKISNCKDANEKIELEILLDEEERKIRRRSGGTVRFIGELFKMSLLTGKIIHLCIQALLKDPNNEDMLECLCKLLPTVGQKFEETNISKTDTKTYSLHGVIMRMQKIASAKGNSKISSRIRFMLQDVIDLRKMGWKSTRNEVPKTMEEIEKEANNEQLSNPYSMPDSGNFVKRDARGSYQEGRIYGGSRSQRDEIGIFKRQKDRMGGGSRNQSVNLNSEDTWHIQTGKKNRSPLDSNKLVGMTVDMNNKKMGGAGLFQWNRTSFQPTSISSNSFAALGMDSNRSPDRNQDREYIHNKDTCNKGSMKRDRYDNDTKRPLSSAGSMEAASEGRPSGSRRDDNLLNMQKQPPTLYVTASNAPDQQQQQLSTAVVESSEIISAPPEVFVQPDDINLKLIKTIVTDMVENAANSKCIDDTTVSCIQSLQQDQLWGLLYYILTEYLHIVNVDSTYRRLLGNIVVYLIEKKYISIEHFRLAYKHFAELASELMVDIPDLWLYIFEFTRPLIVKKLINLNDLWSTQLRESGPPSFSQKFLKTFLQYCTREVGPNFTRNIWKQNQIQWTSFMNENEVEKFIQTNKFEYVENENCQPDVDSKESKEKRIKRVVEHIGKLLNEGCSSADDIIDYINGNITEVDKSFVQSLTTILSSFAIQHSNNYSLDLSRFHKICIPVLLRYLHCNENLELECLNAIDLLVHNLERPKGLLEAIFAELTEANVISGDTFLAWRESKDEFAEKGES